MVRQGAIVSDLEWHCFVIQDSQQETKEPHSDHFPRPQAPRPLAQG